VAAWYIKPRIGRYDKGTEPLPMSDGVTTITGLFILWWGWISFNSGSSFGLNGGKWEFAARAGVGTTLASIASGFTALIFSMVKHKGKVSVLEVVNGVLAGLGKTKTF
jgi:ammonia channel protein AmtB